MIEVNSLNDIVTKKLTPEQLLQKIQCYFLDSNISRKITADKAKLWAIAKLLIGFESEATGTQMRVDLDGDGFKVTTYK